MRHKLLTKALLKKLPPLGATAEQDDPIVYCKFFFPDHSWTWYVLEYGVREDGEEICFGLVDGWEVELGDFSLTELKNTRGKLGLSLERDRWFQPCRLSELENRLRKRRGEM